jgi:hypothetical protein
MRKSHGYRCLTGEKFGSLLVLREDVDRKSTGAGRYWIVQCDCGKQFSIRGTSLTSPSVKQTECKSCCQEHGPKKDLIGKKFGRLKVTSLVEKEDGFFWRCRCDCGYEKDYITTELTRQKSATKQCRHCSKSSTSAVWKGYGEISGAQWSRIKRGAISRGLEFSISIEDAWKLFLRQNGKCALSGVELKFVPYFNRNTLEQTASLDRRDSCKGYTIENIQWIHKELNMMKSHMSESRFLEWCELVFKYKDKNA